MKYDPDDPRITAYLFDELGPEDRARFVAEMKASAELQKLVHETRETIETLQAELGQSDRLVLREDQRAALQAAFASAASDGDVSPSKTVEARSGSRAKGRTKLSRRMIQIGGVAAALLVISSVVLIQSAREYARSGNAARNMQAYYQSQAADGAAARSADDAMRVELSRQAAQTPREALRRLEFGELPQLEPELPASKSAGSGLLTLYDSSSSLDERNFDWRSPQRPDHGVGPGEAGDRYDLIVENDFLRVSDAPLSTFSIDVDTASYSKVRQYLNEHQQLPRPDAVRIEELINYFPYDYEPPTNDDPFAAHLAVATCPWTPAHQLVRVAIKGKEIEADRRPASNLVFLLDVSGSMDQPNKLPLLVRGMKMLADQLTENDRVAIVVYAGAAGMVLDSTTGDRKATIVQALDRLQAGGSTNGGQGIQLAYQLALDHFIEGGTNRVILCTDGDFNVGTTGTDELVRMVERHAKSGVFLTALGFGMGNHNDAMLEQISNKGNGNYAFVDTDNEAKKVLVEQMSATLVTIAKDVKIQVEFNPAKVAAYRLIGYENRLLADQDFNDDTKDAGEIGAGHTVTALYEIIPAGEDVGTIPSVDELKYQSRQQPSEAAHSNELLTLKMRYKEPEGDTSALLTFPLKDADRAFTAADRDFQFAAAVASFGMLLRDSKYKGNGTYASVLEIASPAGADDESGYRREFLDLVRSAGRLAGEGGL